MSERQIRKYLEDQDINDLNRIAEEAQKWFREDQDKAREQLSHNPTLCFMLYCIPDILTQKYQNRELQERSRAGRRQQPQQMRPDYDYYAYQTGYMQPGYPQQMMVEYPQQGYAQDQYQNYLWLLSLTDAELMKMKPEDRAWVQQLRAMYGK